MKPKLIPYGPILFDYHDNFSVICKKHMMEAIGKFYRVDLNVTYFKCIYLKDPHEISIAGNIDRIKEAISLQIDSKRYQEAEYFDIDGYLTPASKEVQVKSKGSEYSITAQVKKSEKNGEQIVIYVGKKGLEGKSQIFVDPTNGKLTFDQNDINPRDIFTEIIATFRDGSQAVIKSSSSENKHESKS